MVWKFALALSALVTTAALSAAGCGGDDCTRAADQLSNCAEAASTSSSSTGGENMQACAGTMLCQSQCINMFTCAEINGNLPDFAACMNKCKGQ